MVIFYYLNRFLNNPYLVAREKKYGVKGINRLSDFRLRTAILPKLQQEADEMEVKCLARHDGWTLSLDGWTDVSGSEIVAVLLLDGSTRLYIGNLNLRDKRHTAVNLYEALNDLLGDRFARVKGIVTDNPRVMNRLRDMVVDKHPHVVEMGCCLHVLNLVCKTVISSNFVQPWAKKTSRLVSFFSNSLFWKNVLSNFGKENNATRFLATYVEVRWYSFITMCQSVASHEKGFKYCIGEYTKNNPDAPKIPKEIIEIINCDIFVHMKHFITILKPIGDAIATLECENASVAQVWPVMINVYKSLRVLRADIPSKFLDSFDCLIESLNTKAQYFDKDIYFVALYLNPPFRRIATS